MFLAEKYAEFLRELNWSTLPVAVQEKTLDLLADWMANAAAGCDSNIGRALSGVGSGTHSAIGGSVGQAILFGTLEQTAPLEAALINAGASHALEFDDAFRGGLFHPGAPVISAVFAACGATRISGSKLLTAIAAGYEVSMRLARAVNPGHNRTWHTTGTVGTFGAAAGAAYGMGLDPEQTVGALGLAGTQAAGLWEILPNFPQAKGLHAGKAAQSGLLAALLAAQGIFGPPGIFEGDRGFFRAAVPEKVDLALCEKDLGNQWLLLDTTIKAYPVCGHTMTAIEAALTLADTIPAEAVRSIEVRAHPVSFGIAGNSGPQTALEAKFSIAFCVVAALVKKRVTLEEFSPEFMNHPLVLTLLSRIKVISDDGLDHTQGLRPATVILTLDTGDKVSQTAGFRKGDPENPLSCDEIKAKFMNLVGPVWGPDMGEAVFAGIRGLPDYDDVTTWLIEHILPWREK